MTELQAPDEETMINVVVADLDDRFERIEKTRIESTVRRLVREWLARARIKTFVGIIAERHAREELLEVDRTRGHDVDSSAVGSAPSIM